MASGVELATAYIQLVPSLRGAQKTIQNELGPIGTKVGKNFSADFSQATAGVGDELGKNLDDNAGGGTGKSTGLSFAKGFVLAGGALITAGLAKAIQSGAEQEVSTDKLAASLGANERQSERLGKIAGRLYSDAFGESFSAVTDSVGAVKVAFRGLGGKELERVTGQAISFADIFETDVPVAINAAKAAVTQGLAKNVTEALDLFTVAGQKVGKELLPDVQDAVTEYGSFFNQLGFGGPKAFSLLAAGAGKGAIGIDKTGDAIAEFTKLVLDPAIAKGPIKQLGLDYGDTVGAIAKGGKGARDAFDKIVTGLGNIDDPAKRARRAIALFGTPIEDLNATQIPGFLNSLKKGQGGFKNFEGAAQKASDTLGGNASTKIESFKRTVQQNFTEFLGGTVLPKVEEVGKKLLTKYGPQIKQFGDFFVNDVVPKVREFIDYLRINVVPVVRDLIQNTIDTIVRLKPKFIETFNSIRDIFKSITSIIRSIWERFGTNIKTFISGILTAVVNIIGGAFKVIAGLFETVAALLRGDWSGVWNGIKKIVSGAVQVVKGIVGGMFSALKFGFSSGFKALKGIATDAFNAIVNLVRNNVTRIVGKVGEIAGKIAEKAKDMVAAGKKFIGGLFDGVLEAARNAGGFVSSLIASIKSAINDALNLPLSIDFDKGFVHIHATLIPAFAGGTDFAPGGLSLVGEEGPELVNLRRGSQVKTAAETRAILAGGGAAAAGAGPSTVVVRIGERDFVGYVSEVAGGVVATAQDMIGERSRATWSRT